MDVAIGFDTSCYTTSIAAVNTLGEVVAFQRMLLPVPNGQRGLRQSEAVFAHIRQMPALAEAAGTQLASASIKIAAASFAPREGEQSYMPVFTVGEGHARALAGLLEIPCHLVTHQQGHIAAGQIGNPPMGDRFIALHISGGTTDLLLCENSRLQPLGGSLDLHAGQLIDRVGVALHLPFPAGPELEQIALKSGRVAQSLLPASMEKGDLECHLSGAETQCARWIEQGKQSPSQIAVEVFDLLARTVARMVVAACRETGATQTLIVGGVSSSQLLRELVAQRLRKLGSRIELVFGSPELSGDNAAGVAMLGMKHYLACCGGELSRRE